MELLDVSDDVVDDVESTVFDNQDEKSQHGGGLQKSSGGEQTDIWGPIREKTQSSGISTQQKSIIQDVLEEIAAGTKDSVKRVGFYFIDSPDGTDCDAEITDQPPTVSWASLLTTTKILVNSQSSSSPQLSLLPERVERVLPERHKIVTFCII